MNRKQLGHHRGDCDHDPSFERHLEGRLHAGVALGSDVRQIRGAVRFLWFNIGVALLVLLLLEGVAEGYLALRERARIAAQVAGREQSYDAGTGEDWVPEYLRELDAGS